MKKDVEGKNYWDRKDAKGKWENRDEEEARSPCKEKDKEREGSEK